VAVTKGDVHERDEEHKGVLLLLCESLHLFYPAKMQCGERGSEQGTDGRNKNSCGIICLKLLAGRGWKLLFLRQ
jgi:hypothetical protein